MEVVLEIGTYSSKCRACGRECSPYEKSHMTNLGYDDKVRALPGCGATFTHVTATYIGMENAVAAMRPDLILITTI